MNVYDPDEVALIDALRREFGDEAFRATLHKHPDAKPFRGDDGIWRIRLGEVECWLGDAGVLSWGATHGPVLHTGTVEMGEVWPDDPASLGDPDRN